MRHSGCFLHLHKGHIHILSEIKKSCNYLVVCLNNDEYLSRKKRQPIISYDLRKADLIKTGVVDEVIEIDDSPIEVIKMIKPDVIMVGSDYTKETTVGYPECLKWGGEIKIVERLGNLSTTEIINQMNLSK